MGCNHKFIVEIKGEYSVTFCELCGEIGHTQSSSILIDVSTHLSHTKGEKK